MLSERTGFQYISTGQIQRKLAQEMGVDTLEMNRLADTDPDIDKKIDGIFIALKDDPGQYVVDSRMAWFFLPQSFKVYLKADTAVAADRILHDPNRNSEAYADREEARQKILARKASENARFLAKYGADCSDRANFDLVVDTTERRPEDVFALIIKGLESRLSGADFPREI